ncbi:MAG: 30S ribosomal protein S3 [Chloroflexi bacterium]|nr:30S ribosomal protein S3 [Chloroflexota bacterium]
MGRKVHPTGFRLGFNKQWKALWFAEGQRYKELLKEDLAIRKLVQEQMRHAAISDIRIERYPKQVIVTLYSARPGIIIGRKGASVAQLKDDLEKITGGKKVKIDVVEVEKPELEATLVAQSIAEQLERRISHRRAMKQAVSRAMRAGAKGIKIVCSGRLSGAEMARREMQREGRVPLQTLRADIDFAHAEALTTLGRIGVKVWIYRGDLLPEEARETTEEAAAS